MPSPVQHVHVRSSLCDGHLRTYLEQRIVVCSRVRCGLGMRHCTRMRVYNIATTGHTRTVRGVACMEQGRFSLPSSEAERSISFRPEHF